MAGPKTALLLQTFARVGQAGLPLANSKFAAPPPPRGRRAKTAGCTPCQAAAKVQAAKDRVRAGR
jgi:hypothetical protein